MVFRFDGAKVRHPVPAWVHCDTLQYVPTLFPVQKAGSVAGLHENLSEKGKKWGKRREIVEKVCNFAHNRKAQNAMDYSKAFKKGGWAAAGRYYATHPRKLKELFEGAKRYASKEGLKAVKDEFLFICRYIGDVVTGRYQEYNWLNLTVIIGSVVYVVSPADIMPDFLPAIGLVDDAALLLWATHEFADELDRYRFYLRRKAKTEAEKAAADRTLEIEDIDFEELTPLEADK